MESCLSASGNSSPTLEVGVSLPRIDEKLQLIKELLLEVRSIIESFFLKNNIDVSMFTFNEY